MVFHIQFIVFSIYCEDISYYFGTFRGLLESHSIFLNGLAYYICTFTYGSMYQLSVVLPSISAYITFIRFGQAEGLLRNTLNKISQNQTVYRSMAFANLHTFYRFHASCRKSVFSQNRIFGYQLFFTLLIYAPASAFMFMGIMLGRIKSTTMFTLGGITISQMLYVFGVHLLAVQYPKRIHRASKLLFKMNSRIHFGSSRCREHVKLLNALQILHTKKCYGITYGSAQLVNMATFTKVRHIEFDFELINTLYSFIYI